MTGNLNGTYNIICFSIAFALIPIAKKIGPKRLHFSLAIGGFGLLCMPLLNDTDILFVLPFGRVLKFLKYIFFPSVWVLPGRP